MNFQMEKMMSHNSLRNVPVSFESSEILSNWRQLDWIQVFVFDGTKSILVALIAIKAFMSNFMQKLIKLTFMRRLMSHRIFVDVYACVCECVDWHTARKRTRDSGGGGGIDGDTDRNASIIRKCFKKDDTRTTDMHTFTADAAHK